jgi:hypothetical protein
MQATGRFRSPEFRGKPIRLATSSAARDALLIVRTMKPPLKRFRLQYAMPRSNPLSNMIQLQDHFGKLLS